MERQKENIELQEKKKGITENVNGKREIDKSFKEDKNGTKEAQNRWKQRKDQSLSGKVNWDTVSFTVLY